MKVAEDALKDKSSLYKPTHHKSSSSKRIVSSTDFGPDDLWIHLVDLCLEKEVSSYKYKLCFFDNIKQNHVLVGKFAGWRRRVGLVQDAGNYTYQLYSEGSPCTRAPVARSSKNKKLTSSVKEDDLKRSAEVRFICGSVDEIIDVVEVEVTICMLMCSSNETCGRRSAPMKCKCRPRWPAPSKSRTRP